MHKCFTYPWFGLAVALAALFLVGCGRREQTLDSIDVVAAGVALAASTHTRSDVLLWSVSDQGEVATIWLSGNANEFKILATRRGVVLPVAGRLWATEEVATPVPLQDCLGGQEDRAKDLPGQAIATRLVDLESGEIREIYAPQLPDEGRIEDFDARAIPIASIGPVLLLRVQEDVVRCATATSSRRVEVVAYDVAAGAPLQLFATDGPGLLVPEERARAFELLRGNPGFKINNPQELYLRDLTFLLSGQRGLTLSYVFSQGDQEAQVEQLRHSTALSASVPARAIPVTWMAHLAVPSPLVGFLTIAPDFPVHGWAEVVTLPGKIPVLLALFADLTDITPKESP